MRFVLSLLFLLVSIVSSAQLFKGVEHLLKYESYLTDMEMALKSNPLKFNRLHHDLLIVKKSQKDEVLGVALDVYMGSFFYFQNNLDSSRFYFERAMNESSKLGQDQMFRTAKIRKIFSDEYRKTKFQMAQEMTAIYVDSYNKKDTINILYSLNGLGLFYGDMDSISFALSIYYEALRIADLSQNMTEKAFIHNNLGLIKYDLGAKDSAFADFQKCLEIGEQLDNVMLQAIGRQNMGLYYSSIDSNDLAKEQYLIVNEIGNEFGYPLYTLSSSTNLAAIEMQAGNKDISDSLSSLALDIAKEGRFLYTVSNIYYGKAFYMLSTNKLQSAMAMLDSAFLYTSYGQFSEVMPPYYHLRYRVYEAMGNHEMAFEAFKDKVAIQDSLDQIGNEKLLAELQFRYDDERKERLRNVEQNKLKIQVKEGEVALAKFRQNLVIIAAIFLVLLFLVIVLYFRYKQRIEAQFSNTLANKLEEERGRIARDLHDGLGQSMIILKNKFNKIEIQNDLKATELNDNFSEVIEEVRSISRSLIPPELKRLGLEKALRNMLTEIERSLGYIVTTDFDVLGTLSLSESQNLRLYRIIQELSTNTLKHSGASSIKIETKVESGQLLFTYQDNGKGLDLDKWRAASNSVGFKSIEQRLMILKGTSKIEKVKTGFKIKFKIPIS